MKRFNQYSIIGLMMVFFIISSCDKDEHELGDLTTPTNLNVSFEIQGVDADNPYGDGSGFVEFSVSASNAITYTINFGDGKDPQVAPNGNITYQFSTNGIITYNVVVSAVGTGGITTTQASQLEVYSSFEDEEALEFLTGGESKSWYWATDQAGFAGMGPTAEDYGGFEFTWAAWWQIAPWDTEKACMYDAEFVFAKTSNGFTFEQVSGPAFIPADYAAVLGVDGDMCHNTDVVPDLYGVKNASFSPSSSNAALVGEYRGTTLILSDNGCMCWWVGRSEYDIIEITETTLKVRIMENGTNSWYHTFVSEKPVQ